MILVDTGPLVALLDPKDDMHGPCAAVLRQLRVPLRTTVPVLTEAFHLLDPGSTGAENLRRFVERGGVGVWFLDDAALARAMEVMRQYADHPMDLADASLVVAGERNATRRIFTLDRNDFTTYRLRKGHRQLPWQILPVEAKGRQ